jgi:hypothetical protein
VAENVELASTKAIKQQPKASIYQIRVLTASTSAREVGNCPLSTFAMISGCHAIMGLRFDGSGAIEAWEGKKRLNDIPRHHNDTMSRFGSILFIL